MIKKYKPPKIGNGDLRVPVTFYRKEAKKGPLPGVITNAVFRTICEVYSSSTKDLEKVGTTTGKHTITINFRNPHKDYKPLYSDHFELIHDLYDKLEFEIKDISLNSSNKEMIKIIGVANGD
ncbi:hypothetical protein ACWEWU_03045 [Staphylococcus xylosus]